MVSLEFLDILKMFLLKINISYSMKNTTLMHSFINYRGGYYNKIKIQILILLILILKLMFIFLRHRHKVKHIICKHVFVIAMVENFNWP